MCLAIPARVVELQENFATVDMAGNIMKISTNLMDDLKIDDYVIVHAGFAINKLDENEALESLRLLRQIAEQMEPEA
jgi:hydrogenase expression/formation protein HypC